MNINQSSNPNKTFDNTINEQNMMAVDNANANLCDNTNDNLCDNIITKESIMAADKANADIYDQYKASLKKYHCYGCDHSYTDKEKLVYLCSCNQEKFIYGICQTCVNLPRKVHKLHPEWVKFWETVENKIPGWSGMQMKEDKLVFTQYFGEKRKMVEITKPSEPTCTCC